MFNLIYRGFVSPTLLGRRKGVILFSLILLGCPPGDQAYQAQQMLNFFQSTCPTQGEWTKNALAKTSAIISTIQSIKNDPNCRALSGALGGLDLIQSKILFFDQSQEKRELLSLKGEEKQLLLQLSSTNDPVVREMILTQLRDTQVKIAGTGALHDANESVSHKSEIATYGELVAITRELVKQANANQYCLVSHPSLLADVGSIAASVAAATRFSGAGIVLTEGVSLLGAVVELMRQSNLNKKVNLLAQNITSNAYQCVLESLSKQWCDAQDAINIIDLKIKALEETDSPSKKESNKPKWEDILLLDREMNLFLTWLDEVSGAPDPNNTAEGDRRQKIYARVAKIDISKQFAIGILNEKVRVFNNEEDPNIKWDIERSAIVDIITKLNSMSIYMPGSEATNPIFDVKTAGMAPWFLIGLKDVPKNTSGNTYDFLTFNPFKDWTEPSNPFVLSLEKVRSRFLEWHAQSKKQVSNERNTVFQVDPLKTVFKTTFKDLKGRSVQWAIEKLIGFLIRYKPIYFASEPQEKIFTETLRRLDKIISELNEVMIPDRLRDLIPSDHPPLNPLLPQDEQLNQRARTALNNIYEIAKLEFGTGFMRDRISMAILSALNDLILNGDEIDQDKIAQLRVADDVLFEIKRLSASDSFSKIKTDIETSKNITGNTLTGFVNVFGSNIEEALQHYRTEGAERLRASLCLKLLAVPSWPKNIDSSLCLETQLPSYFTKGPPSLKVDKVLIKAPLPKRACAYRDYFRLSDIYQYSLGGN